MYLNDILNKLLGLLEHQTDLYQDLLTLIEKEKQAVIATDLAGLNETAKVKDNLLLKIRILDEQREHLLRKLADELEHPVQELTLTRLSQLVEAPQANRLKRLRSAFSSIIAKIQQANDRNRTLFSHSLELVRSSVNLLNNVMTISPVYFSSGCIQHRDQTGKIVYKEI